MTYFMEWLYDRYIEPEIDHADIGDYQKYFAAVDTADLTVTQRDAFDWIKEFYAINGFLLGLRTGAGLCSAQVEGPSKVFLFDSFSLFTKKKNDY